MLVNASFQPSDFYVDTVRNLCSNTTYEFAAWMMNVVNRTSSIMPNITFSIEKTDGTVLQSTTTGLIPATAAPQWKQYGFWFSTPPGVQTVVLRITNNAPGGIGNDLALDDITFRPCGPKVTASILNNNDSINICEDERRDFTLEASSIIGYTNPNFQWQTSRDSGISWSDIPGATALTFTARPESLGKFLYRLTIAEEENFILKPCRIASNRLVIGVHPLPKVEAGPDKLMIKGYTSVLSGNVQGADLTYSWSPERFLSDPNVLDPSVSPTEDILYTLTALSQYGCTSSDTLAVKVADALFIPNAFTPNSDGINDNWRIPFLDPFLEAEVNVYNRYGQRVYHNLRSIVSWDGSYQKKPLPTGVYVYTIRIKKEGKLLRGTVSIVR
jgi:gliding motility-associated-like protein